VAINKIKKLFKTPNISAELEWGVNCSFTGRYWYKRLLVKCGYVDADFELVK